MPKPYSMDLRERVVAAVVKAGMSRRQAAARFGVGVSTVITWVRRFRETGRVAPGTMGGRRPKKIAGEPRKTGDRDLGNVHRGARRGRGEPKGKQGRCRQDPVGHA